MLVSIYELNMLQMTLVLARTAGERGNFFLSFLFFWKKQKEPCRTCETHFDPHFVQATHVEQGKQEQRTETSGDFTAVEDVQAATAGAGRPDAMSF